MTKNVGKGKFPLNVLIALIPSEKTNNIQPKSTYKYDRFENLPFRKYAKFSINKDINKVIKPGIRKTCKLS